MIKTLYLTRNGLMEPLGQSQVFSYLSRLSKDYAITLITFEKKEDLEDKARYQRALTACSACGINWKPQKFRYKPRYIAPALDILTMGVLALRAVFSGCKIIHARSYIPAAVALVMHRLFKVPFVFDMRALWPEELIASGRLKKGSLIHKMIQWLERSCLERGYVVSLTAAAASYLQEKYERELSAKTIYVIPTCVDIDKFTCSPESQRGHSELTVGCVGTVLSGWFKLDWYAKLVVAIQKHHPSICIELVTRDDKAAVKHALEQYGVETSRMNIFASAPEDMPRVLAKHDISVMFFTTGLSKLGSCPTRLGEVLASGKPAVVNRGVGDVASVVEGSGVGIVVEDNTDLTDLPRSIIEICQRAGVMSRCRATAESVFSLEAGVAQYRLLYEDITRSLCK